MTDTTDMRDTTNRTNTTKASRRLAPLFAAAAVFLAGTTAAAQAPSTTTLTESPPPGPPRDVPAVLHADVEVDPAGYLLDGYSLHVGLGWKRLRVDLGAYAMALPRAVHGHDDLDVSFDGYGVKVQYFLFSEQRGGFVGVDAGVVRPTIAKPGTQLAVRNTELGVGVNLGWRFNLPASFYLTPWLGVGYGFNPHTVSLAGSSYEGSHLSIFPAVHLGYRFR